ncbi:Major facilitator sugar transporter-like [Trinorchestia longiramus]|nr:Major facilitator sugar transporter-like [Trinorchestia longiramus]
MTNLGYTNGSYESSGDSFRSNSGKKTDKHSRNVCDVLDAVSEEESMDFDDILPYLDKFGRYQKLLFMAMAPFCFNLVLIYFPHIFVTLEPEHWCRVPELLDLPLELRRSLSSPVSNVTGKYDSCRVYDIDFGDLRRALQAGQVLEPNPKWETVECNSWEYDFSAVGGYASVVSDLDWVCSRGGYAASAQSIFFVGAVVGGLISGYLADKFGRIPVLVGTNIIGAISCLLTATVNSFTEYAIYKFIAGLAFDNIFIMMYVLALEYFAPEHRTLVANMSIAIFYTLGTVIVPWFAILVSDWRLFSVLCSVPMLFGASAYYFVPESVRWLMLQGRTEESLKIVTKIASVNKKIIPSDVLKKFEVSMIEAKRLADTEEESVSLIDITKTPAQLRTFIIVTLYWMLVNLSYDGHLRNVSNLPLDVFIIFTVTSATEFPADTILTLTLDKWGRRWYAFGSMLLSGIFTLLVLAVPNDHIYTIAALAILGRFCVNTAFNIGLQYAAEIMPTVVRAQGMAAVHIAGYVSALVAPQIVQLGRQTPALPLLVLGALAIIAGCLALFLPETLHSQLPETLLEGEAFCKSFKFWSFPCTQKSEAPKEEEPQSHTRNSFIRARTRNSTRGENYRSSLIKKRKDTVRRSSSQGSSP